MTLRLNCGGGRSKDLGWMNLDIIPGEDVDIVCDLDRVADSPLPLKDDSISFMRMEHTLEHLHLPLPAFDELYRVAMPACRLWVSCPYGYSEDAWADPTHVRPIIHRFFTYLSQPKYYSFDYGYTGDWQAVASYFILWDDGIAAELSQTFKSKSNESISSYFKKNPELVREIGCDLMAIKPSRDRHKPLMAIPQLLIKGPDFDYKKSFGDPLPPQPDNLTRIRTLPSITISGREERSNLASTFEKENVNSRFNILDQYKNAVVLGTKPLVIDEEGCLQKGGFSFANAWYLHDRVKIEEDRAAVDLGIIEEVRGEALMLGYSGHYGHFYTDLLDRIANLARVDYDHYVVSDFLAEENLQMVALVLGIPAELLRTRLVQPHYDGGIKFEKLDCPRIMSNKRTISEGLATRLRALPDLLAPLAQLKDANLMSSLQEKGLFVSRQNAKKRKLHLAEIDKKLISESGLAEISPEDFSLSTQMQIFRHAWAVILPAGSECYNLLYCSPGTPVLVFIGDEYVKRNMDFLPYIRSLCQATALDLTVAVCDTRVSECALHDRDLYARGEAVRQFLRNLD